MQIERLLETILILIENKKMTAKKLSELFNVSTRTVYRDIDTLTLAGIPVYYIKGRNGGIYIDEDYSINDDENNKQYYNLALQLLNSIGYGSLVKIEKDVVDDWIIFEDKIKVNNIDYNNIFKILKKAIIQSRRITFIYYNEIGQTSLRNVNPVKIIYTNNNKWFLLGYCNDNEELQRFIFEGITSLSMLPDKFNNILDFDIEDYINKTRDLLDVHLRLSKRVAYKKYDEFKNYKIKNNKDGSYEVKLTLVNDNTLINYILSFGSNVTILSPKWLQNKIKQQCQGFLENN